MPPFKLEPAKPITVKEKGLRIIFTKGQYNPKVKITDWEKFNESIPIDNDPFCPGSFNYFLSHYNNFGCDPDDFQTTTRAMLEQIYKNENVPTVLNPHRRLINYFTYSDDTNCEVVLDRLGMCPKICVEPYISTMQTSYGPPHYTSLKRLALPIIPFLKYRKFRFEDPKLSEHKFYDEGFHVKSKQLRDNKSGASISYNPCTGLYNDGSEPDTGERKCVMMKYE